MFLFGPSLEDTLKQRVNKYHQYLALIPYIKQYKDKGFSAQQIIEKLNLKFNYYDDIRLTPLDITRISKVIKDGQLFPSDLAVIDNKYISKYHDIAHIKIGVINTAIEHSNHIIIKKNNLIYTAHLFSPTGNFKSDDDTNLVLMSQINNVHTVKYENFEKHALNEHQQLAPSYALKILLQHFKINDTYYLTEVETLSSSVEKTEQYRPIDDPDEDDFRFYQIPPNHCKLNFQGLTELNEIFDTELRSGKSVHWRSISILYAKYFLAMIEEINVVIEKIKLYQE